MLIQKFFNKIFKDKDIHSEYLENQLYYAPIEINKKKKKGDRKGDHHGENRHQSPHHRGRWERL